jgi:hypothetical protein
MNGMFRVVKRAKRGIRNRHMHGFRKR